MASIFFFFFNGELPSYKIAEDSNYYAFLDINPLTKGHTLVVPKKETDYYFDLDDAILQGLTVFSKKIATAIEKVVDCKRISVVVFGLEVPHAHVHLIPVHQIDDINFTRPKLSLTDQEFKEIAERIRNAID